MKGAGIRGWARARTDAPRAVPPLRTAVTPQRPVARLRAVVRAPRTAVALIALAAVVPTVAAAQAADGPLRVWLALGLAGAGAQAVDVGMGGTAQLTGQWREHHASLRILGLSDFSGFPDSNSDDSVAEVGLTYGRWSPRSFGYTALAAGLAIVTVDGAEAPPDDTRTTVGIPITADVGVQTTFIGLSLQAFANLNAEASWAGVAARILLGWMP